MMLFLNNHETKNVLLNQIDLEDDCFKFSKPDVDGKLKQSIENSGLLDLPVLYEKSNSSYQIIFGHNRIGILKQLNNTEVTAIVIEELNPEILIEGACLKNFRQEIGTISKIKLINILRNVYNLNNYDIIAASKKIQIPGEMTYPDVVESLLSLPAPLKIYLDIKDSGFKIIQNLTRLPIDAVMLHSEWISEISIRINIFKSIIDFLVDISKRNNSLSALENIDLKSFSDKKRLDELLYHEIFKIRYPDYSRKKSGADEIISILKRQGIGIGFPEYFESDEISIILKIKKRDGIDVFQKKINQIDMNAVRDLLEFI